MTRREQARVDRMVEGLRTAERYRLREWPTYQQGLPAAERVYTIWDRERLIYVGFTAKLRERLSQHAPGNQAPRSVGG
jgi:hypothetical protein